MKWLILLNKTCWIFRKISLDLTPFRTAFGQFSLPLSNLERGKIERAGAREIRGEV
jgi:hypothetical protein